QPPQREHDTRPDERQGEREEGRVEGAIPGREVEEAVAPRGNDVIEDVPRAVEEERGHEPVEIVLDREADDADERVGTAIYRAVPAPQIRQADVHSSTPHPIPPHVGGGNRCVQGGPRRRTAPSEDRGTVRLLLTAGVSPERVPQPRPSSSRDGSRVSDRPHRRYNPLTDEWVLCSPHRLSRPWLGQVEAVREERLPAYDPSCYLCPGNLRANGARNPSYTTTFAFDNDFPALLPAPGPGEPQPPAAASGASTLLRSVPESGVCRVLCLTPPHDPTLAEMDPPARPQVGGPWAGGHAAPRARQGGRAR